MNATKKELKRLENLAEAKKSLNELTATLNSINKMLDEFKLDAKEQLLENNEEGFELVANSIFYFQDIRKVLQTVKIQYQTFLKTSEVMQSIESIRPVLKQTAKTMEQMPSIGKNNKDFVKFKKGLIKGQLNMNAMSSMITTINPALTTSRSKEDFKALKESLLIGETNNFLKSDKTDELINSNDDFFNEINR